MRIILFANQLSVPSAIWCWESDANSNCTQRTTESDSSDEGESGERYELKNLRPLTKPIRLRWPSHSERPVFNKREVEFLVSWLNQ